MTSERTENTDSYLMFSPETKTEILAQVESALDQLNTEEGLRAHVQERLEEFSLYLESFEPDQYFSVQQLLRPDFPIFLDVVPAALWIAIGEEPKKVTIDTVCTFYAVEIDLTEAATQFDKNPEAQTTFGTNNPFVEIQIARENDGTIDYRLVRTSNETEA